MTCATAAATANAPKSEPTSELYPAACRQTAARECSVGLPPEVKEDMHDRATKRFCELEDAMAMSASAVPSIARDAPARI